MLYGSHASSLITRNLINFVSFKLNYQKNWVKFIIGWAAVFLARLLPFRPPNVEPVLATLMPFSKVVLSLGASPLVYRWVVANRLLESKILLEKLRFADENQT